MPDDRPPPLPSFITERDRKVERKPPSRPASQPGAPSAIDVDRIDRNINETMRKQIVDLINRHPDLALSIVRSWKDRT